MDISGFYPALNIDVCAKVAAEMWYDSGMELNLDTRELSLYLAVTVHIELTSILSRRRLEFFKAHCRVFGRSSAESGSPLTWQQQCSQCL